jgi:protein-S-isoprenylcysteine O-methyltransferase Ste14
MKASISDRTSPDSINHDRTVNRRSTQIARLGAWLFRHRTAIPHPLVLALLLIPSDPTPSRRLVAAGVAITFLGEALRLWGVRHIGAISRTRSDRLGPLVDTGPFAVVRNPLYVGNIALWVGFALVARLPWLAPVFALLLAAEYHAIVRWEEELLEARLGEAYRGYAAQVPRWIPRLSRRDSSPRVERSMPFSWTETIFSERGTLIAIAVGYALLWAKAVWS